MPYHIEVMTAAKVKVQYWSVWRRRGSGERTFTTFFDAEREVMTNYLPSLHYCNYFPFCRIVRHDGSVMLGWYKRRIVIL